MYNRRGVIKGVPVSPPPPPGQLTIIVKRGDNVIKSALLNDFAETKIVTHAGKVTFIETAVKEKIE